MRMLYFDRRAPRPEAARHRRQPRIDRVQRGLALGVAVTVMASGCGARWSDSQRDAITARNTGGARATRATTASDQDVAGEQVPDDPVDPSTRGRSGTASGTGGGGPAAEPGATPAARPCDAPSTAPGVSADTLTIGTIVSNTGPVPGLGTTSAAAVRAYVAYRSSQGGVCGRRLELITADDGTDSGRFRAAVTELSPKVLGLAGFFANGDGGGADVVEKDQIPAVGAASTTVFQNVSSVFDTNPPPADLRAVTGKFTYLMSQGVRTAAIATLSNDAAVAELNTHQAQMEAAGIKIVSRQILPITTLSFDSAARTVANSKADYLFFLGAENHDASMAQSMRDTGYELQFEEYLTAYGSNYLKLAGGAADGTTSWIRSLPNEDGGVNPEQAAFLQWMASTAPDAAPDVYAAAAWAGAKAFVDALEQLPGPISRGALLQQLRATTAFDAGGFFGRINLAAETSDSCVVGMIVQDGRWRRLTPATDFLC